LLRCTLAESFDGKKTKHILAGVYSRAQDASKPLAEKFSLAGNKPDRGSVLNIAASVAFETVSKGRPTMTIRTRIALGVSAAAVSLSLALAPAAFAMDKMEKDGMKKDAMSKDSMKKDDGMKKDTMSKDTMKKDDGMKKDEMKK
jgi:pentapeptide MXKDX repeat protein